MRDASLSGKSLITFGRAIAATFFSHVLSEIEERVKGAVAYGNHFFFKSA